MSSFTDEIVVRVRPNHSKPFEVFQLFEYHIGEKESGCFIRCEKGFEFDGTSMPFGMRWLISPSDPNLLQSAAVHDKGFRTGEVTVTAKDGRELQQTSTRKQINQVMAEAMKVKGVRKWKRVCINAGLKVASGPSWKSHRGRVL